MITIKSAQEIEVMTRAGQILAATLMLLRTNVTPGITTGELDRIADDFIRSHDGATPSFKGLYDFPRSICTSVNDEIVHGIPDENRILKQGDIVSIDCGVCLEGLHTDSAITVPVGYVDHDVGRLLLTTKSALLAGIGAALVGNTTGDIGYAIFSVVGFAGYSVIRDLVGHGVGIQMHEKPQIPNYGQPGKGAKLIEGMTLAIEPMVNAGSPFTKTLSDDWTIATADGKFSAHFEHTVLITSDGPRILTQLAE